MDFTSLVGYFFSGLGILTLSYMIIKPILYYLALLIGNVKFAKPLISIYVCEASNPVDPFSSIFSFVGIAMIVSVFLSIGVYLVGIILQNQKLKTYLKTEFLDLLITYGIIIISMSMLYLPCNMTILEFTNTSGSKISMNPYESAFLFVQYAEIYSSFSVSMSTIIGMLSMMSLKAFISNNIFGGISLPVFSGLSLIVKPAISNTLVAVTLAYVLYAMQVLLYEFLTYGAIKYILPMGVLFRAFSPLKKLGGILIGFAIGSTLFYTMVLDFSWYASKPYMKYLDIKIEKENPTYFEGDLEVDFGSDEKFLRPVFKAVDELANVEQSAENLNQNQVEQDTGGSYYLKEPEVWAEEFYNKNDSKAQGVIGGIFRWAFVSCGTFTIILIIIPVINALIVITGVRFFSRFFGMDLDVSNLTKVV